MDSAINTIRSNHILTNQQKDKLISSCSLYSNLDLVNFINEHHKEHLDDILIQLCKQQEDCQQQQEQQQQEKHNDEPNENKKIEGQELGHSISSSLSNLSVNEEDIATNESGVEEEEEEITNYKSWTYNTEINDGNQKFLYHVPPEHLQLDQLLKCLYKRGSFLVLGSIKSGKSSLLSSFTKVISHNFITIVVNFKEFRNEQDCNIFEWFINEMRKTKSNIPNGKSEDDIKTIFTKYQGAFNDNYVVLLFDDFNIVFENNKDNNNNNKKKEEIYRFLSALYSVMCSPEYCLYSIFAFGTFNLVHLLDEINDDSQIARQPTMSVIDYPFFNEHDILCIQQLPNEDIKDIIKEWSENNNVKIDHEVLNIMVGCIGGGYAGLLGMVGEALDRYDFKCHLDMSCWIDVRHSIIDQIRMQPMYSSLTRRINRSQDLLHMTIDILCTPPFHTIKTENNLVLQDFAIELANVGILRVLNRDLTEFKFTSPIFKDYLMNDLTPFNDSFTFPESFEADIPNFIKLLINDLKPFPSLEFKDKLKTEYSLQIQIAAALQSGIYNGHNHNNNHSLVQMDPVTDLPKPLPHIYLQIRDGILFEILSDQTWEEIGDLDSVLEESKSYANTLGVSNIIIFNTVNKIRGLANIEVKWDNYTVWIYQITNENNSKFKISENENLNLIDFNSLVDFVDYQ